jgi:hypothetical protein
MKKTLPILLALLLASPTFAQQQRPMTPVEMTGALAAAVEQGNIARAMHLQAEAKAAGLADELAKAKALIKELEQKPETPSSK